MQRDLEDKLVRHRSVVLARLKRKTNDDGTPVYPSGWRGDGFQEWKSEEIKEILRWVFFPFFPCRLATSLSPSSSTMAGRLG
jgi:hypothetical protein